MYDVLDWKIDMRIYLNKYLRRFVQNYIFGEVSSGQKDGGHLSVVKWAVAMCPAAKWVDTVGNVYDLSVYVDVLCVGPLMTRGIIVTAAGAHYVCIRHCCIL